MATPATQPVLPPKPKLSHRAVANAQVGLSYFIFTGFFALFALQGIGVIKMDVVGAFKEILSLIVYFWFQRSRDSSTEAPAAGTLTGQFSSPTPATGVSSNAQSDPSTPPKPASSPPAAPGIARPASPI